MVEVSPTALVRAMELITILNRCHRFRCFVYQQAHFSADKKSIEVAVRPRKGSVAICSRCHLPAPERRSYAALGQPAEMCLDNISGDLYQAKRRRLEDGRGDPRANADTAQCEQMP
jgi:hypothetical protein